MRQTSAVIGKSSLPLSRRTQLSGKSCLASRRRVPAIVENCLRVSLIQSRTSCRSCGIPSTGQISDTDPKSSEITYKKYFDYSPLAVWKYIAIKTEAEAIWLFAKTPVASKRQLATLEDPFASIFRPRIRSFFICIVTTIFDA
jgi:hypothetical protein